MNTQIKEKWVDALQSGDYEQGNGKLRSHQGFCCLGVLCDIYAQEPFTKGWQFKGDCEKNLLPMDYWYFDGESEFLPKTIMEWAELSDISPKVKVSLEDEDDGDEYFHYEDISDLNDSGYTFSQLAEIIENQF